MLEEAVRFDVATAASKGKRDYQEDSLVASFPQGQETGFAVLADGMGGHLSGDVASALVMSEVFSRIKMKEMLLNERGTDITNLLYSTATGANDRLMKHISEKPETYGMGTTLLAAVIRRDDLFWVSVGDSPLFLFRDGELRQLNKDHSMAPQIDMMVKVGAMDPEVGRNHPDRNTLTSAIAGVDIEKIDCPDEPTKVLPGDILIVSSDGLQFLSNDEIATILRDNQNESSSDISNALMSAITDLDDEDQDNTAFTVIKLGPLSEAPEEQLAKPEDVLVRLRTDLGQPASKVPEQVAAEAAEDADAERPLVAAETTAELPAQQASDIPKKRVIRLVTSKDLSFDRPAVAPKPHATEPESKDEAPFAWYGKQRSSID